MEFKGSRTEQNLMTAFAGESMARNKYDYFASAAKKEGYEQVAAFFTETALNEKEHAKMWLRALAGFADGKTSGDTIKNLAAAAAGEHEEWTVMYKEFARVAREEGFRPGIAGTAALSMRVRKLPKSALYVIIRRHILNWYRTIIKKGLQINPAIQCKRLYAGAQPRRFFVNIRRLSKLAQNGRGSVRHCGQ